MHFERRPSTPPRTCLAWCWLCLLCWSLIEVAFGFFALGLKSYGDACWRGGSLFTEPLPDAMSEVCLSPLSRDGILMQ